MKALEIHLKNGDVFTVQATDVTKTTNRITGAVEEIAWTSPDRGKRKLFHLAINEVAALVVIR